MALEMPTSKTIKRENLNTPTLLHHNPATPMLPGVKVFYQKTSAASKHYIRQDSEHAFHSPATKSHHSDNSKTIKVLQMPANKDNHE